MKTVFLLVLITLSEATIGVFVKLTDGRIPIQILNFYALSFAAVFLLIALPLVTGRRQHFPRANLKDTAFIGFLIALQISVFNFAMTVAPIANVVIFAEVPATGMIYGGALLLGAGFWLTREMSRESTKKAVHPCQCGLMGY